MINLESIYGAELVRLPNDKVCYVFRDGNSWCAVSHKFVDLQQSNCQVFADTKEEAIKLFEVQNGK